jgi:hypothetical protein
MQVTFVYLLPVGTKLLLPVEREMFILWHNVFDGVLVNIDALFASIIFQLLEKIVAITEIIHVFHDKCRSKLLIAWEARSGTSL